MESVASSEIQENIEENTSTEAPQSPSELQGEPIQTLQTLSSATTQQPYLEDMDRQYSKDSRHSSEGPTPPLTPTTSPFKHFGPHNRDSSWLEVEVCREFLRGECSRSSEDCKYAHPTGAVIVKEGNKVTCCFDFLKDRCTREKCKYLHPSNSVKERLVMAGKQYGQNMVVANKPLISSPSMQPLQVGGAYPIPYSSYIGTPNSALPPPNTLTPYSPSLPYFPSKIEVCEAFEKAGYAGCSKGDSCFFSHPEPYVRINNDHTVTVCWNYLNGYCRHHNCWFYHPTQAQLISYQLNANRLAITQQSALDPSSQVYLSPYSPTLESAKVTSPLQLSPSAILNPYPFVYPPQVMQMPSSFSTSTSTQFSKTSLPQPQTIVS